jgi:hypothetical protein
MEDLQPFKRVYIVTLTDYKFAYAYFGFTKTRLARAGLDRAIRAARAIYWPAISDAEEKRIGT